ncbi:hypothetical protein [Longimicrobium sp.]|uniref:hypothetical protein n=1 Tax=Longimicrobium sp. TaxID=2029185 RepID=UPI002E381F8F|nr:hypothetical protein [Longimicrobium sp.]HEX6042351.1 hypothetical protein [Longimicrobium sp.]
MSAETIDRRVLAALRFRDAVTGATVAAPLDVRAAGARWIRNRRGWWILAGAPGLEAHTASFAAPPAAPALGSVALGVRVADPAGRYLPRVVSLALPRNPDPLKADKPDSLFQPVEVDLFPSPAAAVSPNWAVLRVSALGADGPLAGALLRVVRKASPTTVLGQGMTDARGEGLIAVAGIPVTTWEEEQGSVLATEVEARVDLFWQAGAGPPDPDALGKLKKATKTATVKLASGRHATLRM